MLSSVQAAPTTAVLNTDTILSPYTHFYDDVCVLWDKTTLPSYLIWGA